MSVGLITRHLNEDFLDEFVEYYLSEGIDEIFILQDNQGTCTLPKMDNVHIILSNKFSLNQLADVNHLFAEIRKRHTWFIFVDCDEFIGCVNEEKDKTIKDMLHSTYQDVDCILIPWVMMSCNKRETNPPSLLQGLTHRWNHNLRHNHPRKWNKGRCRYNKIEVKAIFKSASVKSIDIHCPKMLSPKHVAINSVYHNVINIQPFYDHLHEKEISHARMLCFHYRIFSKQACLEKFKNNKLDGYKSAGFDDLWITDYPEKEEYAMREKSIMRFGEKC